jgi:hypothetical protein
MVVQLSLNIGEKYFDEPEQIEVEENSRIRYEIPTYIKFYTIYQYDREKFTKLLKIWLNTDEGKNRTLETLKAKQDEILELCYKRDENGNKLRDSDENHIFRYPTLAKIYKLIYNQIGANPFNTFYEQDGLIVSRDVYTKEDYEYQGKTYKGQKFVNVSASIKGTDNLPIKIRVIIHIRLLRLLRKGFSVWYAVYIANKQLRRRYGR